VAIHVEEGNLFAREDHGLDTCRPGSPK
jgi:hypothetical protein